MPSIFHQLYVISPDPDECARALDDQRLSPTILSTSVMISTALRFHGVVHKEYNKKLYKSHFPYHPCQKWVRASFGNIIWTLEYLQSLHNEWIRRGFDPFAAYTEKFDLYLDILTKKLGFLEKANKDMTPFCNYALQLKGRAVSEDFSDYRYAAWRSFIKENKELSTNEKTFESYKNLLTTLWKKSKPRWSNADPPSWYLGTNHSVK